MIFQLVGKRFRVIIITIMLTLPVSAVGNFNGVESDDIIGRDGQRHLNVDDLGASWRLEAAGTRRCTDSGRHRPSDSARRHQTGTTAEVLEIAASAVITSMKYW